MRQTSGEKHLLPYSVYMPSDATDRAITMHEFNYGAGPVDRGALAQLSIASAHMGFTPDDFMRLAASETLTPLPLLAHTVGEHPMVAPSDREDPDAVAGDVAAEDAAAENARH